MSALQRLESIVNEKELDEITWLEDIIQFGIRNEYGGCEEAAAELEAMQARIEKLTEYPERLQKAITELEKFPTSIFTESAERIRGKIEGVKLALGYFEEMTR